MENKKSKKIDKEESIVSEHERFLVIDNETEKHEYDISIKTMSNGNSVYELLCSHSFHWNDSSRGSVVLSIVDDNDGTIKINDINGTLRYDQQHALKLLLLFIENKSANPPSYRVVKEYPYMQL